MGIGPHVVSPKITTQLTDYAPGLCDAAREPDRFHPASDKMFVNRCEFVSRRPLGALWAILLVTTLRSGRQTERQRA